MNAPEANPGPSPEVGALTTAGLADKSHLLVLSVAFTLATIGAFFKLLAWLGGSVAAMVDAATCFANLIAGLVALWAESRALQPPDKDHPYGHERFSVIGSLVITMIYSIIAGVVLAELIDVYGKEYEVSLSAPLYVGIGVVFYALSVAIARKGGMSGRTYSAFTATELLEGGVTLVSSLVGALFSSLIDYLGGVFLLAYLFGEIVHEVKEYTNLLTDTMPRELSDRVKEALEKHGLKVKSLRIRTIVPGKYHGDIVVEVPSSMSLSKAHDLVDRALEIVKNDAKKRDISVDLTIHYEPSSSEKT